QNNKPYSVELAEITSLLFANCNEKEARHATKYGVSIVESRCIRKLREKKQLTVNQMAQEMSLTSSRVTRIIDSLVAKKMVVRESGANDRRVYNLSLTPKGEKLANDLIQDHIKIHEQIINNVPEKYHHLMIEILQQLNKAVEAWLENNCRFNPFKA
ncbi:MAG: MarR family transcriptional regulator, partial [bacterium]